MRAIIELCAAAAFSIAIRWYSTAEQVPCAIITERWKIVSQDAAVSRAIMMGRAKGEVRSCFLMRHHLRIEGRAARGMGGVAGMVRDNFAGVAAAHVPAMTRRPRGIGRATYARPPSKKSRTLAKNPS
jgi:hypothetical protein